MLTKTDLEAVTILFHAVKNLQKDRPAAEERLKIDRFDTNVRKIIESLQADLEGEENAAFREGDLTHAKFLLYDLCFAELVEFATINASAEFAVCLRKLRRVFQQIFSEFPKVLHDTVPHVLEEAAGKRVHPNRPGVLRGGPREGTQSRVRGSDREQENGPQVYVDSHGEILVPDPIPSMSPAHVRRRPNGMVPASSSVPDNIPGLHQSGPSNGRSKSAPPRDRPRPQQHPSDSRYVRGGQHSARGPATAASASITRNGKRDGQEPSRSSSLRSVRPLTLKQLAEYIEAIYLSKEKFDQKCLDAHLPRETLEQHLYTYLNQRYGLKSLIVDYAHAILAATRQYANVDNDVAVFEKILKHEIDEDFHLVQRSLKDTLADLLRMHLANRYPLKSEKDLSLMLRQRLTGYISESEWTEVLLAAYEGDDAKNILGIMQKVADMLSAVERQQQQDPHLYPIAVSRPAAGKPRSEPVKGRRLLYSEFLKTCLDYQLKGHETFLKPFVKQFRRVDADKNGVLNENEFRQLVVLVDNRRSDGEVSNLLMQVDPDNNQQITFSEAVAVLSDSILLLNQERDRGGPTPPPQPHTASSLQE